MTRILVIGKGIAYQSFLEAWSRKDVKNKDLDQKAYYYVEFKDSSPVCDVFIPVSLNDVQKSQLSLIGFNRVYIFPDELTNGTEMVAFFNQIGIHKIFVITHNQSFSSLYKKLGADYVIVSHRENGGYRWLFYHCLIKKNTN